MDKNKKEKFVESLTDFHHVILGLCGAAFLALQCTVPMDKDKSNAMFVVALILLGYCTLVGSVSLKHKINDKKETKAEDEFAKQKRLLDKNIMSQKNHIK